MNPTPPPVRSDVPSAARLGSPYTALALLALLCAGAAAAPTTPNPKSKPPKAAAPAVAAAGGATLVNASARPASARQTRPSNFEAEIREALADKALAKGTAGIAIARIDPGSPQPRFVYSHNAQTPLIPASNLKVVTTSAALAILGPDFKFRTTLLTRDGDLYLLGDGDPTLADPEITEKAGWTYDTVFKQWAAEAKKQGITSIRNVYVDDSIFDAETVHPNWPANQLNEAYSAQVAGLNFHFNTIDLAVSSRSGKVAVTPTPDTAYVSVSTTARITEKNAVGADRATGTNNIVVRGEVPKNATETFPITIHDPALFGGTVLAEVFRREGITVAGNVSRSAKARTTFQSEPAAFKTLGILETPLRVVLARCNKDSANLYAESLAKRLAAKATGRSGSWAASRETIGAWLLKIGVPADQFKLDDGCGLSRQNRVSPELMVRVLTTDLAAPYGQLMLDSLAVGGIDGTLSKRFDGPLKGRVFAKSGFINAVYGLSGFLKARNGQMYVFSILLNDATSGRAVHEKIVKAIDDFLP